MCNNRENLRTNSSLVAIVNEIFLITVVPEDQGLVDRVDLASEDRTILRKTGN